MDKLYYVSGIPGTYPESTWGIRDVLVQVDSRVELSKFLTPFVKQDEDHDFLVTFDIAVDNWMNRILIVPGRTGFTMTLSISQVNWVAFITNLIFSNNLSAVLPGAGHWA